MGADTLIQERTDFAGAFFWRLAFTAAEQAGGPSEEIHDLEPWKISEVRVLLGPNIWAE